MKPNALILLLMLVSLAGCVSIPPVPAKGTDTDFAKRFPAVINLPPVPALSENESSFAAGGGLRQAALPLTPQAAVSAPAAVQFMDLNLVWNYYSNSAVRGLLIQGCTNLKTGCWT